MITGTAITPDASVTPAAKVRQVLSALFFISNLTLSDETGVLSGNLNVPVRLKVEPYAICSKSVAMLPIT